MKNRYYAETIESDDAKEMDCELNNLLHKIDIDCIGAYTILSVRTVVYNDKLVTTVVYREE